MLRSTSMLAALLLSLSPRVAFAQPAQPAPATSSPTPSAADASDTPEGTAEGEAEAEAPPTTPDPAEAAASSCCYTPVAIEVIGFDKHDAQRTEVVRASLYINGRLVGQTPFEDALPASRYRFELEWEGRTLLNEVVDLEPGQPYEARRTVELPPTPEQLAAIRAQREAKRAADLAALAAQRQAHARAMAQWQEESAPIRHQRQRMRRTAIGLGVSGTLVTVAGLGAFGGAISANTEARNEADLWAASLNAATRANHATAVTDAERRRDRFVRAGAPLMGLGTAAAIAAIVVAATRPALPPKPRPTVSTLHLSPVVSRAQAGLQLSGRF